MQNDECKLCQMFMEISCTCKIVKNFKCEKCEKTFTRNSDLNGHMKSAHKELIFQNVKCEICHDSFLNMQNLKVHLKIGHEGQEFFECDLCSVIFWTTNCLEKHIKTVHTEISNLMCFPCDKTYR